MVGKGLSVGSGPTALPEALTVSSIPGALQVKLLHGLHLLEVLHQGHVANTSFPNNLGI